MSRSSAARPPRPPATTRAPDPPIPEVITPSGGRAYLFKVPGLPHPFRLHNYPKGWKGLELRGAGAIQVMPPSRLPNGRYRFADGWTLEQLMGDLADLPPWLLERWIALDARAPNLARDGSATAGQTRNPAPAAELPSDLPPPSSPSHTRGRVPPAPMPKATTTTLTTITTPLSADDYTDFEAGEVEIDRKSVV
jgi:hypothetical protein